MNKNIEELHILELIKEAGERIRLFNPPTGAYLAIFNEQDRYMINSINELNAANIDQMLLTVPSMLATYKMNEWFGSDRIEYIRKNFNGFFRCISYDQFKDLVEVYIDECIQIIQGKSLLTVKDIRYSDLAFFKFDFMKRVEVQNHHFGSFGLFHYSAFVAELTAYLKRHEYYDKFKKEFDALFDISKEPQSPEKSIRIISLSDSQARHLCNNLRGKFIRHDTTWEDLKKVLNGASGSGNKIVWIDKNKKNHFIRATTIIMLLMVLERGGFINGNMVDKKLVPEIIDRCFIKPDGKSFARRSIENRIPDVRNIVNEGKADEYLQLKVIIDTMHEK